MALREIRTVPDSILRSRAKQVKEITPKIIELLNDMKETLIQQDGIGIAAPQVGVLKAVIIVMIEDTYIEIINPKIVETRGLVIGMEACLSIPEETGYVRRPHYVKIIGLNRDGEEIEHNATGLVAVALCHEMDHLIGVLFTDRQVTPTERELAMLEASEAKKSGKEDELPEPAILSDM